MLNDLQDDPLEEVKFSEVDEGQSIGEILKKTATQKAKFTAFESKQLAKQASRLAASIKKEMRALQDSIDASKRIGWDANVEAKISVDMNRRKKRITVLNDILATLKPHMTKGKTLKGKKSKAKSTSEVIVGTKKALRTKGKTLKGKKSKAKSTSEIVINTKKSQTKDQPITGKKSKAKSASEKKVITQAPTQEAFSKVISNKASALLLAEAFGVDKTRATKMYGNKQFQALGNNIFNGMNRMQQVRFVRIIEDDSKTKKEKLTAIAKMSDLKLVGTKLQRKGTASSQPMSRAQVRAFKGKQRQRELDDENN